MEILFCDDNSSEHQDSTSVWIDIIDRGGVIACKRHSVPSVLCNRGRDEKTHT